MSEKYNFFNTKDYYFVTFTVVYWIDIFTRKELKEIIIDSLKWCQENKGLVIHSWVLMPSHLHIIISSKKEKPGFIIRDFKKFTNSEIIKTINSINESRKDWLLRAFVKAGKDLKRIKGYKVWQDNSHPVLLQNNKLIKQRLNYIHQNPVVDEIVSEDWHYLYSSAGDYCDIKGYLDIDYID